MIRTLVGDVCFIGTFFVVERIQRKDFGGHKRLYQAIAVFGFLGLYGMYLIL